MFRLVIGLFLLVGVLGGFVLFMRCYWSFLFFKESFLFFVDFFFKLFFNVFCFIESCLKLSKKIKLNKNFLKVGLYIGLN